MFEQPRQPQQPDENAIKFRMKSTQESIDALERRKERATEKASLAAQIRVLRLKLEKLELEDGIGHA